jgi:hypothetical protein
MKSTRFLGSVCLLASFALLLNTGCKKDSDSEQENSLTALQEIGQAENINADMDHLDAEAATLGNEANQRVADVGRFGFGSCATVTRDSIQHTITIDFGTGCTGRDGRTRSGQIQIQYTGRYFEPGASWTVTFSNYHVDGRLVEGSRTVTNNGLNASGNMTWTIEAQNMRVTLPDGRWRTWDSQRTREMIAGYGDSTCVNDVYKVNGTASGSNDRGDSYTATMTDLIREHDCRWITSGSISVTASNRPDRIIDFGNGTCDDEATVTVNGITHPIHLR